MFNPFFNSPVTGVFSFSMTRSPWRAYRFMPVSLVDFSTRSIRYARFARTSTTFFRRHRQPPTLRQLAALRRVAAVQAHLGVGSGRFLVDLSGGDRVTAPPA